MILFSAIDAQLPCDRRFTAQLAERDKASAESQGIEVVFVSSDNDRKGRIFSEYFAEMPWLAVPNHNHNLKSQLFKKFDAGGAISMLVILDGNGNYVTNNGSCKFNEYF